MLQAGIRCCEPRHTTQFIARNAAEADNDSTSAMLPAHNNARNVTPRVFV